MARIRNKKKNHHFVHDGYLNAWRMPNTIFVFDLLTGKTFEATGRNTIGACGKFNNFSFDERVVNFLNYTFMERAIREGSSNVYKLMLSIINCMKNIDYAHKAENFLEDFYEKLESRIACAMRSLFRGELQVVSRDPNVFDSLIIFYCLQLMRTPKARRLLSSHMLEISFDGVRLDPSQKEEYVKMFLLINSLAAAMEILDKGCSIRLRYAKSGEKFVNSDAPVILTAGGFKGCVPLSPRLLMEIDNIGQRFKNFFYDDITNSEVNMINIKMIKNAERTVYFSSRNHRENYVITMISHRAQCAR